MSPDDNSVNIKSARRPYHHGDLRAAVIAAALRRLESATADTLSLREVARALDQHWIETPQRHIRLQVARLTDALRLIDDAMLDGRLDAIDPLLKVLDRLDRYNALGQTPEKPRLLALTHSGHENALNPLESAVRDLSAAVEQT